MRIMIIGNGPAFVSSAAYQYCRQYNADMLNLALASPHLKNIILSSRWTNWRVGMPGAPSEEEVDIRLYDGAGVARSMTQNRDIFAVGFEDLIKALSNAGKTIWVVGPVPEPSNRIPKALYIEHLGFSRPDLSIPMSRFLAKNDWILNLFRTTALTYPIKFIWPHRALCNEQQCPVVVGFKPLFFDDNHLSIVGARKTSPLFDEIFVAKRD